MERTVREAIRRAKLLFSPSTGHALASRPAATRRSVELLTGSLANFGTESDSLTIDAFTADLLSIEADRACWVRLYSSSTALAADSGRAFGALGEAGVGLLAEFVFSTAAVVPGSPVPTLTNTDATPIRAVWYAVQNRSGSTSTVALSLTILPSEG